MIWELEFDNNNDIGPALCTSPGKTNLNYRGELIVAGWPGWKSSNICRNAAAAAGYGTWGGSTNQRAG